MHGLPEHFVRTQRELYGARGEAWVENLPALIAGCERRWSLKVGAPFDNLSYNFVAPAVQADGGEIILKLGVPNKELVTEIEALRLYDGHGICRLLDGDVAQGILLLERLQPGTMLSTIADEEATAVAAQVMGQLWRPLPAEHPFPTTATWGKGLERLRKEFDGGTGPFPARMVEQAERLFGELVGSSSEQVLLHGDLHHYNILRAERQPWLAIDPKGLVGEPAYEIGAFLRNPDLEGYTLNELKVLQARRVEQFAVALGIDRERILAWSMAQAVLSAWWTYEDHGRVDKPALALAQIFAELVG
jgi:streptomycin 6-kinase